MEKCTIRSLKQQLLTLAACYNHLERFKKFWCSDYTPDQLNQNFWGWNPTARIFLLLIPPVWFHVWLKLRTTSLKGWWRQESLCRQEFLWAVGRIEIDALWLYLRKSDVRKALGTHMDLTAPSKRESPTIWRGAMNSTAGFATDVHQCFRSFFTPCGGIKCTLSHSIPW